MVNPFASSFHFYNGCYKNLTALFNNLAMTSPYWWSPSRLCLSALPCGSAVFRQGNWRFQWPATRVKLVCRFLPPENPLKSEFGSGKRRALPCSVWMPIRSGAAPCGEKTDRIVLVWTLLYTNGKFTRTHCMMRVLVFRGYRQRMQHNDATYFYRTRPFCQSNSTLVSPAHKNDESYLILPSYHRKRQQLSISAKAEAMLSFPSCIGSEAAC